MYDDRLEIYSPGGLMDGGSISEMDIMNMPSRRRNPVLADIFSRLKYMGRRGSGFKKIVTAYQDHDGYTEGMKPKFATPWNSFVLTLPKFDISNVYDGVYDSSQDGNYDSNCDSNYDGNYDKNILTERQIAVLHFCKEPKSTTEVLAYLGVTTQTKNRELYINKLVEAGLLAMTIPDKLKSKNQKYVRTNKPVK